jgi:hypothetical protein
MARMTRPMTSPRRETSTHTPGPKVISFERSLWGHNFHASTWRQVPPRTLAEKLGDWWTNTRRYSVLVHSMEYPGVGDLIRYPAEGGPATARIYAVEWLINPRDMFKLMVLRDEKLDLQFNVLRPATQGSGE